jgi:hypothetical protein
MILGQFKQKDIYWFIHEMLFKVFFSTLNLFFVNYNNFFEYIIK